MTPSIHASAGRKGKAVEHLIAALCVLGSDGELNAWTSIVDDEGVDLVFQRREQLQTISVQVKSRFTTAKGLAERGRFQTQVRGQTFRPRADLLMLFVVADPVALDVGPIWLVLSERSPRSRRSSPTASTSSAPPPSLGLRTSGPSSSSPKPSYRPASWPPSAGRGRPLR